jgi:hypothetical protein
MKIPDSIDLSLVQPPSTIQLANDIVKNLSLDLNAGAEASGSQSAEVATLSKALIVVANQLWRITGAIIDPDLKEPKSELSPQELKKVGNSLESIKETLGTLGLKIIDRVGEPFNTGLPEQVVTEEPRDSISSDRIIRTIRPTLMWHQTMVQRGEIDIAVPAVKK